MKLFLLLGLTFSISSFAQMDMSDVGDYMQRITNEHSKSVTVIKIKQDIEEKYNVICTGGSSAVIAPFYFPVTYRAKCLSESTQLHLKIVSVVKTAEDGEIYFKLKKYQVRF